MFVRRSEFILQTNELGRQIDELKCELAKEKALNREEQWKKKPKKEVDFQQKSILFDMGLTGHEDLGVITKDGGLYYWSRVHCGPFSKDIYAGKPYIDSFHDPQGERYQNTVRQVRVWMEELKCYENRPCFGKSGWEVAQEKLKAEAAMEALASIKVHSAKEMFDLRKISKKFKKELDKFLKENHENNINMHKERRR